MAEMHHATPGAGRRIAWHVVLAALLGAVVIAIFQAAQPALLEWATADPQSTRARARLLIGVLAALVIAPVAGIAMYLARLGGRVVRERRFPPEGLAMIRDVIVVRGPEAVRKGRVLQFAAAALTVLSALMAVVLWRLATLSAR
jgi:hypothetical protein